MHVRVVRFTDVSPERMQQVLADVKAAGGPPEGIPSHAIDFLYDEGQQVCVVVQRFDSEQDMESAARVLGAMPASDTPGTRASVDTCELKLTL